MPSSSGGVDQLLKRQLFVLCSVSYWARMGLDGHFSVVRIAPLKGISLSSLMCIMEWSWRAWAGTPSAETQLNSRVQGIRRPQVLSQASTLKQKLCLPGLQYHWFLPANLVLLPMLTCACQNSIHTEGYLRHEEMNSIYLK